MSSSAFLSITCSSFTYLVILGEEYSHLLPLAKIVHEQLSPQRSRSEVALIIFFTLSHQVQAFRAVEKGVAREYVVEGVWGLGYVGAFDQYLRGKHFPPESLSFMAIVKEISDVSRRGKKRRVKFIEVFYRIKSVHPCLTTSFQKFSFSYQY